MGAELSAHPFSCLPSEQCMGTEAVVGGGAGLPAAQAKRQNCVAEEWIDADGDLESSVSIQSSEGPLSRTVIVFDWDDTLLSTSAVRNQTADDAQLHELERAVESILRAAMELGETLIVTNGNGTWVQDTTRAYMPGLLPLLSEMEVVSARALYEEQYPGDPFKWKIAAFEQLFLKERHFPAEPGVNLVALGDQYPELDAAQHVVQKIGGCSLVKTVKFREAPSLPELIGELCRTRESLTRIAHDCKSQSFGLVRRTLPPCFENLISSATAWSCLTKDEAAQGRKDPILGIKGMLSILA